VHIIPQDQFIDVNRNFKKREMVVIYSRIEWETLDAVLVSWNLMEVWVVLADMHPDKPIVCSPSSRFKKLSLRLSSL
jgi:hypothetical protein